MSADHEAPGAIEELKQFVEFLQNLWATLAGVSVLFPLSNTFAQIIPLGKWTDGGFAYLSPTDVFLLMEDTFDMGQLTGEARVLFDHAAAQAHFGASVFWLRRLAAFRGRGASYCRVADEARRNLQRNHRNRGGAEMIANDNELKVTLERIARFQEQVAHLRRVETNPQNYHGAVSGFLAEIDRMQLEVREFLSIHPAEVASTSTS